MNSGAGMENKVENYYKVFNKFLNSNTMHHLMVAGHFKIPKVVVEFSNDWAYNIINHILYVNKLPEFCVLMENWSEHENSRSTEIRK